MPIKARIICPFYKRHTDNRRTIVCEGVAEGRVETAMVFTSRELMERYSGKYCETFRYNRCPLARAINLKIDMMDEAARR